LIDTANPLLGLLFPTALFAIPWIVSAVLLGSYQANRGIKSFMARALNMKVQTDGVIIDVVRGRLRQEFLGIRASPPPSRFDLCLAMRCSP
jgi:hypothetical protein